MPLSRKILPHGKAKIQAGAGSSVSSLALDGNTLQLNQSNSQPQRTVDLSSISGGGDITGVTAGDGLTGGGNSGAVTLAVGVGTGLDVSADAVTLDLTEVGFGGGANRLITDDADGTVTTEANLTFDGSTLGLTGNQTISGYIGRGPHNYIDFTTDNVIRFRANDAQALDLTVDGNGHTTFKPLTDGKKLRFLQYDGNEVLTINDDESVTIAGDLTVQGTTTTIDSTTLSVKDKNIEMGAVSTPSDTTADGGGITLKGATDKTFNWVDSTDSWTSSEHLELASGKSFRINANNVLNQTTLGSTVVGSSLTSVGTLTSATISGDLAVDTDTLKVDTSNDRVGINVASPTDTLNISTGAGTFDFRDYNLTYSTSLGIRAEAGYLGLVAEAANDVFISTNGFANKRLVVKSDGNVGIGTTGPQQPLHILTSANDKGILIDVSDDTHEGRLIFGDTSSNGIGHIGYNHSLDAMRFFTNGAESLRLESDQDANFYGDVSTLDSHKLKVVNASSNYWAMYNQSNGKMRIDQGTTQRVLASSGEFQFANDIIVDGKVGIGGVTPSYPLHINGAATQEVRVQSSDSGAYSRVQLRSATDGYAQFNMGDSGADAAGGLDYTHSSDTLAIRAANAVQLSLGSGVATFTTTPTVGTMTSSDNSTKAASTAYVTTAVAAQGGGDVYKVGTPVDNQIGVWTGDGTIEGSDNFTYDGTDVTLKSSTSSKPVFTLENTNADAYGPKIVLKKNGSSPLDDDTVGTISFLGENDNNESIEYANIVADQYVDADGSELGRLVINTYDYASSPTVYPAIRAYGGNVRIYQGSTNYVNFMGGNEMNSTTTLYMNYSNASAVNIARNALVVQPYTSNSSNPRVGVGVSSPNAKLDVLSATTQQRWSYDGTYYTDITVANDGDTEVDAILGELSFKTSAGGKRIRLDSKGDIQADLGGAAGTYLFKVVDSSVNWLFTVHDDGLVGLHGSDPAIEIKERASAPNHTDTYGKLWVKNDDPANLYYTDDDGNDIALTDNGSAAGGGSPGGSDTQVQFNDGGAFGADAGLTYVKGTDTLTVASNININANLISGSSGHLQLYAADNVNLNSEAGITNFNYRGAETFRIAAGASSPVTLQPKASGYDLVLAAQDGTAVLHLDSTDKRIGIGTTNPSAKFSVTNAASQWAAYVDQNNTGNLAMKIEGNYGLGIETAGQFPLDISTASAADALRMLDNGNLGIGTTSPGALLDIHQNADDSALEIAGYDDKSGVTAKMHVASNGMAQFVGSSHTQVKATTDSVYISAAEHLYLDNGTRNTYSTIFRDGTGEYARFKNARLGLGTTGPDEKLDVRGDIQLKQTGDTAVTVLGDANRSGADSHIAALRGKWNGTAVGTFMVMSGPDTTNKDDGQLTFQTASAGTLAERMRIDETGNVGIGTTTPDYTLELENTAPQLGFNDTNGRKFYLMSQSDKFWLGDATGGTTPLVVDSAGKVGIGTTSPDSKMTVQGDLDIPVNSRFRAGSASSDTGVDIYHDGSNNYTLIENRPSGGDLIFRQMHNGKDYIFKADNDSGTEQEIMRIDGSNARVGIGTNSPGYDLEVYKADADGDPTININDGNNYLRAYISDAGYVQSNHPLYLWSRGSGQYTMLRSENEYVEINAGDYINFKTSGGQAARLLGNGKFGIGTTSPDQYLHVKAGSTDQALKLESTDGNVDATFTDTGGSGIIRFATNIFKFYTAADYSVNPLNINNADVEVTNALSVTGPTLAVQKTMKNDVSGDFTLSTSYSHYKIMAYTGEAPTNITVTITAPASPRIGDEYTIVTECGDSPAANPGFANQYTATVRIIANTSQTINFVNTNINIDSRQSATLKYKMAKLICIDTNAFALTISDVGPVA